MKQKKIVNKEVKKLKDLMEKKEEEDRQRQEKKKKPDNNSTQPDLVFKVNLPVRIIYEQRRTSKYTKNKGISKEDSGKATLSQLIST